MPAVRRAERCMTSCPTTAHTTGAGKTPAFPSRNPPAAKRRPCGKLFRKGSGFPAAAAAGPHAADGCAGEGGNAFEESSTCARSFCSRYCSTSACETQSIGRTICPRFGGMPHRPRSAVPRHEVQKNGFQIVVLCVCRCNNAFERGKKTIAQDPRRLLHALAGFLAACQHIGARNRERNGKAFAKRPDKRLVAVGFLPAQLMVEVRGFHGDGKLFLKREHHMQASTPSPFRRRRRTRACFRA